MPPTESASTPVYCHLILGGWRLSYRRRRIVGDCFEEGPAREILRPGGNFSALVRASPVVSVEITLWPWPPEGYRAYEVLKRLWLTASLLILRRVAARHGKRIVVFDLHDLPILIYPRLLALSNVYYKREYPLNRHDLFLRQSARPDGYKRFDADATKLRPISFGCSKFFVDQAASLPPREKQYDVFWAGDENISTLRRAGRAELDELRASGLRVFAPTTRIDRSDYYRAMSESWLAWAPEGRGWYTYRMFEALLCGTVPIVSWPKVVQEHPFEHGVHGFVYEPSPGGLTRCLNEALGDQAKLRRLALQGRDWVLTHHRLEAIQRRHLFPESELR